jgi:hypothetical protein
MDWHLTQFYLAYRMLDRPHDASDRDGYGHVVWPAITGHAIPHPGSRRLSALEAFRTRQAHCRFRTPLNDYPVSPAMPTRSWRER